VIIFAGNVTTLAYSAISSIVINHRSSSCCMEGNSLLADNFTVSLLRSGNWAEISDDYCMLWKISRDLPDNTM